MPVFECLLLCVMKRHCQLWLPKKKRFCHFPPHREDAEFCSHHVPNDAPDAKRQRVPCPIDPKHTVYANDLEKHVKKCPALRYVADDKAYFQKDINVDADIVEGTSKCGQLQGLSAIQFKRLVTVVEALYEKHIEGTISTEVLCPDWGIQFYEDEDVEKAKHVSQQSSIAGHLARIKLLATSLTYMEFGAGKGGLSFFISKVVKGCDNVLIDRKNFRRKLDAKVDRVGETKVNPFKRLYIDIKDLVLSKVDEVKGKHCVVISKHLCGGATDVTLRCFTKTLQDLPHPSAAPTPQSAATTPSPPDPLPDSSTTHTSLATTPEPQDVGLATTSSAQSPTPKPGASSSGSCPHASTSDDGCVSVDGAAIALCCHQVCNWNSYVGRTFFTDNHLDHQDFAYLCSITSWAICGQRPATEEGGAMTNGMADSSSVSSGPVEVKSHVRVQIEGGTEDAGPGVDEPIEASPSTTRSHPPPLLFTPPHSCRLDRCPHP